MKRFTFLKAKALIFSVLSLAIFPSFAMEMEHEVKKTVQTSKNSIGKKRRDRFTHRLISKLGKDEMVY